MPKKKQLSVGDKIYLSVEQMLRLELENEREKLRKAELDRMEEQKKQLSLQKQALKLQMECLFKDEQLLENLKMRVKDRHTVDREKHKLWVKELREELGIEKSDFGYNPETGEIS